jgi:NAD-dependent SIR2 family protein deacetylase
MDDKVVLLKKWIADSENIVFFGGAGVSTESGFRISAAWTGCISKNGNTRPKRS